MPAAMIDHSRPLRTRDGRIAVVRPVDAADLPPLQDYFRDLSETSRYSRMLGGARELPPGEQRRVLVNDDDHHSLIVTTPATNGERIIGEARLVHEVATDDVEVSLSLSDEMQGKGLGSALLDHLQSRAASFGLVTMYGDTLRSNTAMIAVAKHAGFRLMPTPGDWRLVRFYKVLEPTAQPMAGARIVQNFSTHGRSSIS